MVMMQTASLLAQQTGGYTHKVVLMRQHLELVAQLADNFGNEAFAAPTPQSEVLFAAKMHDSGWFALDGPMPVNEETRVPRNLLESPAGTGVLAGPASADTGRAAGLQYAELLISMHHTGLQRSRYHKGGGAVPQLLQMKERAARTGVESQAAIGSGNAENEAMLKREDERQRALIDALSKDEERAAWVRDDMLWTNYRLLQFFDTFALYFCLAAAHERQPLSFPQVPLNKEELAEVTITPLGANRFSVHPFPFSTEPLVLTLAGSLVRPNEAAQTTEAAVQQGLVDVEHITLVRGESPPQGSG